MLELVVVMNKKNHIKCRNNFKKINNQAAKIKFEKTN